MMSVIQINYLDRIDGKKLFEIVPLNKRREWMNQTSSSFAYHCLPLVIANEHAWGVPSPYSFEAEWDGGDDVDNLVVLRSQEDNEYEWVSSHFGNGVLTINLDFILTTDRGISTYIRGMPNYFKKGIQPLDAIVETDWLPFTFTYNYLFTEPGRIRFEKDEILFSFFPIRRTWIESFQLVEKNIQDNPKFYKQYKDYDKKRYENLKARRYSDQNLGFQKYYKNAQDPNGESYDAFMHRKQMKLKNPTEE